MIVGGLLVRNEADRYLARVLEHNAPFYDKLVVVDDASTDNTRDICRLFDAEITRLDESTGFWGRDEAPARGLLWEKAVEAAGPGGWILIFDADMELLADPEEIRHLCRTNILTAWAWPLYDVWDNENTVRVDGLWGLSAQTPRVWLVKAPPADFVPDWGRHGHHVGHCPPNLPLVAGTAPGGIGWKHLAYLDEENRKAKSESYLKLAS